MIKSTLLSAAVTAVAAGGALNTAFAQSSAAAANASPARNVVLVHGAFADGSGWRRVYDKLTKRGYRVTIVQNPLTSLADDVAATNRALALQDGPTVLVGHSWGGFDTVYLSTHTKLFAAGVAGAPITNLVSNYGNHHWTSGIAETDHIETGQQRMEVPMWEDLQAYIRNSAVFGVHTMTTPLSTATPKRAMKPTPALIEKFMPRRSRASTPPVMANGMPVNTSAACLRELKVVNSNRKIRKKVTGTTTISRLRPLSRCLNIPPQSIV